MDDFDAADFDIESVLNLFEDIQDELRQEGKTKYVSLCHIILTPSSKTILKLNILSMLSFRTKDVGRV